jgi:hypothetical protein
VASAFINGHGDSLGRPAARVGSGSAGSRAGISRDELAFEMSRRGG